MKKKNTIVLCLILSWFSWVLAVLGADHHLPATVLCFN